MKRTVAATFTSALLAATVLVAAPAPVSADDTTPPPSWEGRTCEEQVTYLEGQVDAWHDATLRAVDQISKKVLENRALQEKVWDQSDTIDELNGTTSEQATKLASQDRTITRQAKRIDRQARAIARLRHRLHQR